MTVVKPYTAKASVRREEGIRLLLAGGSAREIAAKLSVGTRTVERWKAGPQFADALTAKNRVIIAATEGDHVSLAEACGDAVRVMGRRLKALARVQEPEAEDALEASVLFRAMAGVKIELTGKDGGAIEVDHGQPLDVVLEQYAAVKGGE